MVEDEGLPMLVFAAHVLRLLDSSSENGAAALLDLDTLAQTTL